MQTITYQVLQKPIEDRIIDAATIYWEVERSYFSQRSQESTQVYRRSIVFYLIKENTLLSYEAVAKLFGFLSHQNVMDKVDTIEARKNVYPQVGNDIKNILRLAEKLDAQFVTCNIQLHTIKPAV